MINHSPIWEEDLFQPGQVVVPTDTWENKIRPTLSFLSEFDI